MLDKKVLGLIGIVAVAVVATIGVMKWFGRSDDSTGEEKSGITAPLNQSSAEAADWCVGHRVPESECTKCHPNLVEAFKAKNDWCAEHGLPESHCRECNPNLKFPQEAAASSRADWCAEHRVPESGCTKCHPALIEAFKAKNDWCAEHGLPESHCRLCNPNLVFPQEPSPTSSIHLDMDSEISVFFPKNKTACATDGAIIQFASAKTAERAGLTIEPAIPADAAPAVEAPAEVIFDETRTTAITSTVPILVIRWLASPGQPVKKGEVIAEVESPEMANLKADYLENLSNFLVRGKERKRNEELRQQDIVSVAEFEASLAAEQAARAQLTRSEGLLGTAGLSPEELQTVESGQSVSTRFALKAPGRGMLVKRQAVLGELLPAGTPLALISDPNSMWVEARMREQDLKRIRVGQRVEFSTDVHGQDRHVGRVIWAAQFLDPVTRSATVRVKMQPAEKTLHPGEFGRALIYTQGGKSGVLVPIDAVQWEGCCNVVFVEEAQDRYRPRKVQIEPADPEHYRVTAGLKPGEPVVVKGSYLLKTELKKGSIGAGCCAPEPAS